MIVAVEDGKCRGERSNVSLSSRVPCECGSVPCEQSQGSQHEKRLRRDSEGLKVEEGRKSKSLRIDTHVETKSSVKSSADNRSNVAKG